MLTSDWEDKADDRDDSWGTLREENGAHLEPTWVMKNKSSEQGFCTGYEIDTPGK